MTLAGFADCACVCGGYIVAGEDGCEERNKRAIGRMLQGGIMMFVLVSFLFFDELID